jgi:hypothetical protein
MENSIFYETHCFRTIGAQFNCRRLEKANPRQITIRIPQHFNQCCGAGAVSRGAKIKLPSRAGAGITNCSSGSFLFIKDLKKFYGKKSWMLFEEVFVNYYNFNPIWVH